MMALFGEMNTGPLHMGDALVLEGSAEWDSVALISYPSKAFFDDLVHSSFMLGGGEDDGGDAPSGVGSDKQVGDTIALATMPYLSRL